MNNDDRKQQLVAQVRTSPLYAHFSNNIPTTWAAVPTLSREQLVATPLTQRLFVDWSAVEILRPTSGTSGKGILIIPRALSEFDLSTPLQQDVYKEHHIKRLATFSAGQPHFSDSYMQKLGVETILLDPSALDVAARLVAVFQPDMMAGPAYALERFAHMLPEATRQKIKAVQVFGERASQTSWDALGTAFPNAQIFTEYAMIETQASVGAPCSYIRNRNEQYFHMIPDTSYLDLIDEESGAVVSHAGNQGELLVTTLRPSATMLLRYKTGDFGRIVATTCPCGNGPIFAAEGRIDTDRIRIPSGELNVAEMDRVIARLRGQLLSGEYQARYQEGEGKPQLVIALDTEEPELFTENVAKELRITPTRSYQQAVDEEVLAPLKLVRFEEQAAVGKRKRLIRVHS